MKDGIREKGIDYVLVGDYYIPDLKLPMSRHREFHLPVKSGSFYISIIETSENGKNISSDAARQTHE